MAGFDLAGFSQGIADLAQEAAPMTIGIGGHRRFGASGFHWKDGLFVAAEESLNGDDEIEVTLASGETARAQVKGKDPSAGIALLEPAGAGAPGEFARSQGVAAGNLAVVVGNAGGSPLAAFGSVSECGPAWRSMRGGLIDARLTLAIPVDGRFEGGAALDAGGALIGMMLFGPRRKPLVIPAATIDRVATVLARQGFVSRGFLGAGLHPMRRSGVAGAMVMSLDDNGPAKAAGMQLGDIVTSWNGDAIDGPRDLIRRLGPDSVGVEVTLAILRGGEKRDVKVTIGTKPLG